MPQDSPSLELSATTDSHWLDRWRSLALGGWLFRQRTWLPVPFIVLLLISPPVTGSPEAMAAAGAVIVLCGQLLRLWAVRHIGVISRTRAARLGPLISSGPYALVRNPLYVGNGLLWAGFAVWSRVLWLIPLAIVAFVFHYSVIAQWEEMRLVEHFGEAYVSYQHDTPAWVPRWSRLASAFGDPARHGWNAVCFSERGTLVAVTVLSLLLLVKQLS